MQIKRFEASDMQEAMRQVKETLGPEAIILSTKTVRRPTGPARMPRPSLVEVVAAADHPATEKSKPAPKISPLVLPRLETQRGSAPSPENPFLQRMLSAGISPGFVRALAKDLRGWKAESRPEGGPESCLHYLRGKLMDSVEVTGPEAEGAKVWSFIGPTGVGKTTTLAKLAAHFSLRLAQRITLVTIDTYRIGAVDQLKTYARILGLPLEIASGREDFQEILWSNRDRDLVLVDTAGRNPHSQEQLEELKGILTADPRVENHLVLSATTKDFDLARTVERFSLLPIRSYIFTKLDETDEYSSLFNQLLRFKRPLSYLTSGQKVPEDIELATKGRVASLVLNRIPWN
jgi:flagellar biosynthesis protein FlhF